MALNRSTLFFEISEHTLYFEFFLVSPLTDHQAERLWNLSKLFIEFTTLAKIYDLQVMILEQQKF